MKVLISDDDSTNRLVLSTMLKKWQYEVIITENGKEAVEAFIEHSPDMVLIDVMMPVMDGYEATTRIKSLCVDRFVPVIFITAMTDEPSLAKCIDVGGDDFLNKPINRIILQAKILAFKRNYQLYQTVSNQKHLLEIAQEQSRAEQVIAEKIHSSIVTRGDLVLDCIQTLSKPSCTFSGDIVLTAKTPTGGIHILVGDFTGHGLSAAIGAMPASDVFYSMSEKGFALKEVAYEINQKMYTLLPTNMFLAAAFIHLDLNNHIVEVWNAGVPDIIVIKNKNAEVIKLSSSSMPLGIISSSKMAIEPKAFEIESGDRIVMLSDGITDVCNADGVAFGEERLQAVIIQSSAENCIDNIQRKISEYGDIEKHFDDITLVQVHCDSELLSCAIGKKEVTKYIESGEWQFELVLNDEMLRNIDPLPIIIQLLMDIQGLDAHRTNLFTILSELYNNALDHGVLNLDSKLKEEPQGFTNYYNQRELRLKKLDNARISIKINSVPKDDSQGGCLTIEIKDSGEGFDYNHLDRAKKAVPILSGRGVNIVRSICKNLDYLNNGSTVIAQYNWK